MWKVIFDHFPLYLLSPKKWVTDGPTDGRTDIPSYRDAWTHLKKELISQLVHVYVKTWMHKRHLLGIVRKECDFWLRH